MKYISIKGEQHAEYLDLEPYRAYLETVKDRFPPNAWNYAAAPWHYDYTDPRSAHDLLVQALEVLEHPEPLQIGNRYLNLRVQLSDSAGYRRSELSYSRVRRYCLSHEANSDPEFPQGHRQWWLDEVILTEDGYVVHEIGLDRGQWLIECKDFSYAVTLDRNLEHLWL